MKKRNLAIVMAMAMTTIGGVTVFAADKKTEEKTEEKMIHVIDNL